MVSEAKRTKFEFPEQIPERWAIKEEKEKESVGVKDRELPVTRGR